MSDVSSPPRPAAGAPMVPLTGWGRTAPTPAVLIPVHGDEEAQAVVRAAGARGVLARGLARSYGDAAQNAGGDVLDMTRADRVLAFDPATGEAEVEAGISLQQAGWLDLLVADGTVHRVSPETDPELFWATAGGMGLTGVVLRALVRLKPVETSRMLVDTERAADFDDL